MSFCFLLALTLSHAPQQVRLVFLGDIMLGRGVALAHNQADWQTSLAFITPYTQSANLTLANLESPLGIPPAENNVPGSMNLCANPESVAALSSAGVDLLAIENNHKNDCRSTNGQQQTAEILARSGIKAITSKPLRLDIEGIPFSFLAYDDISERINIDLVQKQIAGESKKGRKVIVSLHWGGEYRYSPSEHQQRIAQSLADAGAFLVWGHHPHIVQNVQWLSGKNQTSRTLVLYSLGNTLFDQSTPPATKLSVLFVISIDAEGIKNIRSIPFKIDPHKGLLVETNAEDLTKICPRLTSHGENVKLSCLPIPHVP